MHRHRRAVKHPAGATTMDGTIAYSVIGAGSAGRMYVGSTGRKTLPHGNLRTERLARREKIS